MKFSEKIIFLLSENGLSQNQFAKEIGANQASVSDWFRKNAIPHRTRLQKIASYFGVTVKSLINDDFELEYESKKTNNRSLNEKVKRLEWITEHQAGMIQSIVKENTNIRMRLEALEGKKMKNGIRKIHSPQLNK